MLHFQGLPRPLFQKALIIISSIITTTGQSPDGSLNNDEKVNLERQGPNTWPIFMINVWKQNRVVYILHQMTTRTAMIEKY